LNVEKLKGLKKCWKHLIPIATVTSVVSAFLDLSTPERVEKLFNQITLIIIQRMFIQHLRCWTSCFLIAADVTVTPDGYVKTLELW